MQKSKKDFKIREIKDIDRERIKNFFLKSGDLKKSFLGVKFTILINFPVF